MWHRKPEKYKEYENMENIVVGYGELVRVPTGWRTPSGFIIEDRNEAIKYAINLDTLIRKNQTRIKAYKNRFK